MPVYVAIPEGPGPWPGVVVICDGLGMTTDLKRQADWLAREGFLAAVPDLYYWGGRIRCMFSAMRQLSAGEGDVFADFEGVRRWLTEHDRCTGAIGVIGFCLAGGFALLLAAGGNYAASSVNYGALPDEAMTQLANACPVVGSYGGKDRTLREAPDELERVLAAHDVAHDIKVYPEAGNPFLNDHSFAEMPLWALVSGKYAAAGYHEPPPRTHVDASLRSSTRICVLQQQPELRQTAASTRYASLRTTRARNDLHLPLGLSPAVTSADFICRVA